MPKQRKLIYLSVIFIWLFSMSGFALAIDNEEESLPFHLVELEKAILDIMDDTKTPGVGVCIVDINGTIWSKALGKSNLEDDLDVSEKSLFRIGSISKMFVSLAVLKMQEEGLLNLKDEVRRLVPEIEFQNPWSDTNPILIEHLLEHTTGWDDIHITEYAHNKSDPISLKEGLDFHPHSRTSRWVPGTRMSYCNSGPGVAAYIVEKLSGEPFEKYIQEHFFDPIGLENMTFYQTEEVKENGVRLYIEGEPQNYWHILMRPSGSINATISDMAKFVQFYLNRGKIDSVQIISDTSLQRMEKSITTSGSSEGLEVGYGLSNIYSSYKSFNFRGHNGGVNGGISDLGYNPEHGIGYAFMMNSSSVDCYQKIKKVLHRYITKDLEIKKTSDSRKDVYSKIETGLFLPLNPRSEIGRFIENILSIEKFWYKGDTLFHTGLLGGKLNKYLQVSDKHFASTDTGKISAVLTEDPLSGQVIQAGSKTFKRYNSILLWLSVILFFGWLLITALSIIMGIIWLVQIILGKISNVKERWVRLWPFITSISLVATFVVLIIGSSDAIAIFGVPGLIPILFMLFTCLFAIFSIVSAVYLVRNRTVRINSAVFFFSTITVILHFIATAYLASFGIIGYQTWS